MLKQTVLKHISGCLCPRYSSLFIKDSSVWSTGLWRPCRQSLLTAHLTRWPRAALLPLPVWLLLHTKDLPTEARSLILASRKQLQPYSSQDRRTNSYLLQAHKKLNPFGGYGCTRASLLTGSRSCFPLYISGEQQTLSLTNTELEVNTISSLPVIARRGRERAGWVELWQSPWEAV